MSGSAVTPQNSKYASSISTAVWDAAVRMRSITSSETPVPVGLLGLAISSARVRGVMAASNSSTGKDRSPAR